MPFAGVGHRSRTRARFDAWCADVARELEDFRRRLPDETVPPRLLAALDERRRVVRRIARAMDGQPDASQQRRFVRAWKAMESVWSLLRQVLKEMVRR